MVLMVMGGLKGPEEAPTLLYLAFLLPNTLHIFSEYEISGLQDYLAAIPDEDIRIRQLGVCLVPVPLLYLFITFLLRTFSGGGIGKLVDKKGRRSEKERGYADCRTGPEHSSRQG